jgi:signal transduction histidine kinase
MFSRPWFRLPGVILSRDAFQTLQQLEGKKVGVVHGYIWDDLVSQNRGKLKLVRASDSHTCVELAVKEGIEAMVGDMASVTWILNRSGGSSLRVRPIEGQFLNLNIAIRPDWQLFKQILDKALQSIPQSDYDEIENKWIQVIEPEFWEDPVFQVVSTVILLAILSILLAVIYWNRSLKKEVSRQSKELEKAAIKLIHAEKMESIGLLAAGFAHEVKNPLAILQMGVDHLLQENHNQATQEALLDMEQAVQKADGTIKKLLGYSRVRPPEMKAGNISSAVSTVLSMISHECHLHNIKIETDIEEQLPLIVMDMDQIQQLLMNIMLNAIQAMEENGTLSVDCHAKILDSKDLQRDNSDTFAAGDSVVWVEVRDTGHGIDERNLGKVFDPFFTTRPVGEGTGLGLAVSLNIIRNHGASIDICNRKEGGVSVVMIFSTCEGNAK